jgi:hypothetical protein
MSTGDKSAQSYGWRLKLIAPVLDGADVVVPAPDYDTRYTDTRYTEVTLLSKGTVWRVDDGKVAVAFNDSETGWSATVTNATGDQWPAGDEIYVFCPHLLSEGSNEWDLKGQIWDLQQRVNALEGARKTSEEPKSAPKPVVEPPKAPPEPHKANIPPAKAPNSPQRGPNPPPRGSNPPPRAR